MRVCTIILILAACSIAAGARTETQRVIRVGLVDFDTSHVVEFTKRLHRVGVPEDQWVDGARVVAGCPGESAIMPERIGPYTEQLREMGCGPG